jgi:hypothetical protein
MEGSPRPVAQLFQISLLGRRRMSALLPPNPLACRGIPWDLTGSAQCHPAHRALKSLIPRVQFELSQAKWKHLNLKK